MLMPDVSRYMTREPYRLAPTDSLRLAHDMMVRHLIRHLPVLDGERLVGMVSDSDIRAVQSLPGVTAEMYPVSRIMTAAEAVWGETPLQEVIERMTEKKCDAVVVLGGSGVEGIFTSIDALHALGTVLERTCG